jgi:very-short-patch-repair endonuclease
VHGYEVDLHWPEHKLIAEVDGWLYHGHRHAFETDRERDLVLATYGWRTVRLTALLLGDRATVADRFSLLLGRAPLRAGRSR